MCAPGSAGPVLWAEFWWNFADVCAWNARPCQVISQGWHWWLLQWFPVQRRSIQGHEVPGYWAAAMQSARYRLLIRRMPPVALLSLQPTVHLLCVIWPLGCQNDCWPWTASLYSDGILKESMRYSWKLLFITQSLILDRSKRNGKKDRSCMYSKALRQPAQCINSHWVSSTGIYGVHKHTMDLHEHKTCFTSYRKKTYVWELHIKPLHLKMSRPCPYMFWAENTNLMKVVMLIVIASQSCSFDGQTRHW